MNKPIPYITFYSENKINPVSQDISDIGKHFRRRESLFRHLGIAPALIKDKNLLEFGPGGGYNALYTKSLSPAKYVLVDANPTSLDTAKRLLSNFAGGGGDRYGVSFVPDRGLSQFPFF
jgi:ubiquinone/menaquinone biosynthesis C-methylase UbiE